jgi:transcriptional regulator with XRE-family HTH domain
MFNNVNTKLNKCLGKLKKMNTRLEEIRKNSGLSKKDFANKIEITEQAYQNYSNGKRNIPTDVALKIKHMFNISLDWLLDGENKKELIDYKKELLEIIENMNNEQIEYLYHTAKAQEIKFDMIHLTPKLQKDIESIKEMTRYKEVYGEIIPSEKEEFDYNKLNEHEKRLIDIISPK